MARFAGNTAGLTNLTQAWHVAAGRGWRRGPRDGREGAV